MASRYLQKSFGGGEVTPELFGRIDDPKYISGVETMKNFIALPHGPAQTRPGFSFVRETRDSTKKTRLIPFSYSSTQTAVIELGAGWIRFHSAGATFMQGTAPAYSGSTPYVVGDMVLNGGSQYYCIAPVTGMAPPNVTYWYLLPADGTYEIPSPYAEDDLFDIKYVQSADVLTLVHTSYPPKELKRLAGSPNPKWSLTSIVFVSNLAAPTSVVATPTGGAATYTFSYQVTAIGVNSVDESLPSTAGGCSNNLFTTGARNSITWAATPGAQSYKIYKQTYGSGQYGFIGSATSTTFTDENIAADLAITPPLNNNPFGSATNYPGAVSYHEQRRCFAGTISLPQTMWLSKSGTESCMNYSIPTRDDDSVSFKIAAREANTIRHIVPLQSIVLLTSAAEWKVSGAQGEAITPSSLLVRPQSYIGSNNAAPIMVNNNLIYAAARGGHVRELGYSLQAAGYITGDLSLRAPHLFDGNTILDMAFQKSPQPICWFVSSSGKLLGMTYVPEQQIFAWHQHSTDGLYESITVVAEGDEDFLYAVVRRTINGTSKRYIERMASRLYANQEDAFFVDCGLTYSGASATTFSNLNHLEGKTINILSNGAVHRQLVVTGGSVTLDRAATKVQFGLPIQADLKTLPIAVQTQDGASAQGRMKNVNKAWLRVYRSSGVFIGPNEALLVEAKIRNTEAYGLPPSLKTDELEIVMQPSWDSDGSILIRQSDPLPLTVVALTLEFTM
jgi:hypothetical protein